MITDVAKLYDALGQRLPQLLAKQVHAPSVVIEDACQFAWCRLIHHARRVDPDTAFAWLTKAARREAVKLARREQRKLSLEAHADHDGELNVASPLLGLCEQVELRERLAQVRRLSVRQQRLLWLRAVGYSDNEIVEYQPELTGRIIERQIKRGRRKLRAAA